MKLIKKEKVPYNQSYTFARSEEVDDYIIIKVYNKNKQIFVKMWGYHSVDELYECLSQIEELKGERI